MDSGADLAESLPRGERAHKFTLRYDNGAHYHRCMRLTGSPIYVQLDWRQTADSPVIPVGLYRLDLRKLLAAGFVRLERENHRGEVRVRIVRSAHGSFFLQVRRLSPELILPTPTIDWGSVEPVPPEY